MRASRTSFASLVLWTGVALGMFDCKNVQVDKQSFDLSVLAGPHSVVTSLSEPPTHSNLSYTLDLCAPLKRKGDVRKGEECPNGTRVCAIEHTRNDAEDKEMVSRVIPLAGDLADHGGQAFEYEATPLRTSSSGGDGDKEGLRLVLKGGVYQKVPQRAVIEMLCDSSFTGLEGEWPPQDEYQGGSNKRRSEEDDGSEKQYLKDGAALLFRGYELDGQGNKVLKLEWKTKVVCGRSSDDDRSGRSWGWFTWFLVLNFLIISAYLVFSSWLNYSRYGARGWDLLPHSDAIRDVPYLFQDFARKVLTTVQGAGSRGGYSAV